MKTVSWKDATQAELLQLECDNVDVGAYAIMCDSEFVSIWKRRGYDSLSVPRDTFNKLLDEYFKPREIKPARKARKRK